MPKLPIIKSIDFVRALKMLGFFEHRQNGSHLVLKHSDGRRVVVAIHAGRDIPSGTLHAMLRDISLTSDQLRELL